MKRIAHPAVAPRFRIQKGVVSMFLFLGIGLPLMGMAALSVMYIGFAKLMDKYPGFEAFMERICAGR